MTVNFEALENNEGVLTFEIDKETIDKALDSVFKQVRKNLTVPGFRKGKVPRQIFNNVYGEEALYEDALNQVLPDAYQEAVKEAGIEVVAQPRIDIESMEKGQPWVIKAEVALKPEVELGQYKDLEVTKQDRQVTDEEVEESLENRRKEFAELVLKDSAAESGDTVVIDYEGFKDGEAFEGGKDENYSLKLGSNSFIPGFEDQLIGAEPDSDHELNLTFPEDYHAEDLASQEVVFKVHVHEVKAEELPELDDEFAKDVDENLETLDELKAQIRQELEEAKADMAQEMVEDEALRKAVDNAEVVGGIPHEMVHEEVHRQMDYFLNNLQRQGINPDLYYQITGTTEHDLHQQYEEDAEIRTKTNLVLEAIIKAEDFQVTAEDRDEEAANLAKEYGMEVDQVRQHVTEDMLESDIKMKRAMSVIVDSAKEVLDN